MLYMLTSAHKIHPIPFYVLWEERGYGGAEDLVTFSPRPKLHVLACIDEGIVNNIKVDEMLSCFSICIWGFHDSWIWYHVWMLPLDSTRPFRCTRSRRLFKRSVVDPVLLQMFVSVVTVNSVTFQRINPSRCQPGIDGMHAIRCARHRHRCRHSLECCGVVQRMCVVVWNSVNGAMYDDNGKLWGQNYAIFG